MRDRMQYELMKWAHVALMGYWIGSDLVLNALTLYVARAGGLPPPERRRLWDFMLHVDQHPRNALILSFPTGVSLAAWSGLVPLGATGLAVCRGRPRSPGSGRSPPRGSAGNWCCSAS